MRKRLPHIKFTTKFMTFPQRIMHGIAPENFPSAQDAEGKARYRAQSKIQK
jgi:hypothetical protein